MVFCGKCGFQLTSGNATCPRCGTPTETEFIPEESQPDSPTIATSTSFTANQSPASSQEATRQSKPVEQQPIILSTHPTDYSAVEQMANDATNMMGAQYAGPGQIPTRAAYPEYAPQSAANFPQQGAPYPGYTMATSSYDQQYGASSEEAEKVRARGRITGLLLILIGLLCILGAMVLFIMTRTTSTSAPASIQQVQHVVFVLLSASIFR